MFDVVLYFSVLMSCLNIHRWV